MALNKGIIVLNAPGTIDADYRGEIGVIVFNTSAESFQIKNGDRIAQLVVSEYITVCLNEVYELTATDRGTGGYGSTGNN